MQAEVEINWENIQQAIAHKERGEQFSGLVELYSVARSAAAATEITHHCTKIIGEYLQQERPPKHTAVALTTLALFGNLSDDNQLLLKMALADLRREKNPFSSAIEIALIQQRTKQIVKIKTEYLFTCKAAEASFWLILLTPQQRKEVYKEVLQIAKPKSIIPTALILPYLSPGEVYYCLCQLVESKYREWPNDLPFLYNVIRTKLNSDQKAEAVKIVTTYTKNYGLQIKIQVLYHLADNLNQSELDYLLRNITAAQIEKLPLRLVNSISDVSKRRIVLSAHLPECNREQILEFFGPSCTDAEYKKITDVNLSLLTKADAFSMVKAHLSKKIIDTRFIEALVPLCDLQELATCMVHLSGKFEKRADFGKLLSPYSTMDAVNKRLKTWSVTNQPLSSFDSAVAVGFIPRISLKQLAQLLKSVTNRLDPKVIDDLFVALKPIAKDLNLEHLVLIMKFMTYPYSASQLDFVAQLTPEQIKMWCDSVVFSHLGHADPAVHKNALFILPLLLPRLEELPHPTIKSQIVETLHSGSEKQTLAAIIAYKSLFATLKKKASPIVPGELIETVIHPAIFLSDEVREVIRTLLLENATQAEFALAMDRANALADSNKMNVRFLILDTFALTELPDDAFQMVLECVKATDKFPERLISILSESQVAVILELLPETNLFDLSTKVSHPEISSLLDRLSKEFTASAKKALRVLVVLQALIGRGEGEIKKIVLNRLIEQCVAQSEKDASIAHCAEIFKIFTYNIAEMNEEQFTRLLNIAYRNVQMNLNGHIEQLRLTLTLVISKMSAQQLLESSYKVTDFLRSNPRCVAAQECLFIIFSRHIPGNYFKNHESLLNDVLRSATPCSLMLYAKFVANFDNDNFQEFYKALNAQQDAPEEIRVIIQAQLSGWLQASPPSEIVLKLLAKFETMSLINNLKDILKLLPTLNAEQKAQVITLFQKTSEKEMPALMSALHEAFYSSDAAIGVDVPDLFASIQNKLSANEVQQFQFMQRKPSAPRDLKHVYMTALEHEPLLLKSIEWLVNPDQAESPVNHLTDYLRALATSKMENRCDMAVEHIQMFCALTSSLTNIRCLYNAIFNFTKENKDCFQFIFQMVKKTFLQPRVLDLTTGRLIDSNDNAVKIVAMIRARLLELLGNQKPTAEDQRFMNQKEFKPVQPQLVFDK